MLELNPDSLKNILEECMGNAGKLDLDNDNKEGTDENEDLDDNQRYDEAMNIVDNPNE